jgi:hypothetical protein
MGIEPTAKALPELENKRVRANADAKCDWRVNFRGMWGYVGVHRCPKSRASSLSVVGLRTGQNPPLNLPKLPP